MLFIWVLLEDGAKCYDKHLLFLLVGAMELFISTTGGVFGLKFGGDCGGFCIGMRFFIGMRAITITMSDS